VEQLRFWLFQFLEDSGFLVLIFPRMKRKQFILVSAVGITAIAGTGLGCGRRKDTLQKLLSEPVLLEHICDAKTLAQIGDAYRRQMGEEVKPERLQAELLSDSAGQKISESSSFSVIQNLLDQKIHADFATGNVIVLDGWVLSQTEARQCALFSFVH
jgi:hypothetical protein